MSEHADSFPPFVADVPNTPRRPVKEESLRSWLRRQRLIYGWRTRLLFALAVATVALFWHVAGVWQPTVIATAPEAIGFSRGDAGNTTATISGDERLLAIWTGKAITIKDRPPGNITMTLPYPAKPWRISFSADGRSLFTQDEKGFIRIFNVLDGTMPFALQGGMWNGTNNSILSPDGSRVALNDRDGRGALWDCRKRTKILISLYSFSQMLFTPDGRYFVALEDWRLRRWNALDGKLVSEVQVPDANPGTYPCIEISSLLFSADGATVAYLDYVAKGAVQVHLIDAGSGTERIKSARIDNGDYSGDQFAPDGRGFYVYTSTASPQDFKVSVAINFVDLATGAVTSRPPEVIGRQFCLSPDGRLLACQGSGYQGTLVLNARTLQTVANLPNQFEADPSPFSSDSQRFIIRDNNTPGYAIYDTHSWKQISTLSSNGVYHPIGLADGSILNVQSNSQLVSWTQHRPDGWRGVAMLWQFWVAYAAVALFVCSAIRDNALRRRRAPPAS